MIEESEDMMMTTTPEVLPQESSLQEPLSSSVHPRLAQGLREVSLFGALTEVSSARFLKYLMQPKLILRNGWLLDPSMEIDQSQVRAYVLRPSLGDERTPPVGQRLVIDRHRRCASLITFSPELTQEIRVDMESMQVLENRVTAPISWN